MSKGQLGLLEPRTPHSHCLIAGDRSALMALALLRVFFDTGAHGVPLDETLATIAASCSGTTVGSEDFYSEFRRMAEASLPDSSLQRPAIIEDIDSAQKSAGLRKQLEIPMASGGSLKGHILLRTFSLLRRTANWRETQP